MFEKKLNLAKFECFFQNLSAYSMMHTMCDNAAKYLVCRFVRFRKHLVNSDTFVLALLYYIERWDFQDFEK